MRHPKQPRLLSILSLRLAAQGATLRARELPAVDAGWTLALARELHREARVAAAVDLTDCASEVA